MKNILLIIFFSQSLWAQLQPSIYPQLPYSDFTQIASEGEVIFVSGDCDVAMVSLNNGLNWETIYMPHNIVDIDIIPGTNGKQAILTARDGIFLLDAESLQMTELSTNFLLLMSGNLYGMHLWDSKMYALAGGSVYQSDISDPDWSLYSNYEFEDVNDFMRSTDIVDGHIYLGSNDGELKSINLTTGELRLITKFGGRVSNIEMVSDEVGYADVQGESVFLKTVDGGNNWTELLNMPEKINPVAYGEDIIMSINTNRFYLSTDGGQTSTYISVPEDASFQLVGNTFIREDGMLFFCGNSNMVLSSEDFGMSLNNLNEYNRSNLIDLDIADSGIGYAVGSRGATIMTSDGGSSWTNIDLGISNDEFLTTVTVFNDGRTIITGDQTYIIEDGALIETQDLEIQSMLHSKIEDALIAVGSFAGSYALYRSTDKGATWDNMASTSQGYVRIHQSSSGKIYVPTNTEFVFVSEDNGENWDVEEFGFSEVRQVAFLDDQFGIFVHDGGLYRTTDGGQTGESIANAYLIDNLHIFNDQQMMYTSAQNGQTQLRYSENGGESFSTKTSYCSRTRGTFYDGEETIWFAQEGGHINNQSVDLLSSAEDIALNDLSRVYPNIIPANTQVQIILDSPKPLNHFRLVNLMGQDVSGHIDYDKGLFFIDDLLPGQYYLSCEFGSGMQSHLIIVN